MFPRLLAGAARHREHHATGGPPFQQYFGFMDAAFPSAPDACEEYCGPFSWILGIICCWCVVCCPCDSRQVYNAPDGKKVLASGTPSGQFVEMC